MMTASCPCSICSTLSLMSDDEINKIAQAIDPDPAKDPTAQQRQEQTLGEIVPTGDDLEADEVFDPTTGAYATPGWTPPNWTPPDSEDDPTDA